MQRSEHRQKQEEAKLLRITKVEKKLRRVERRVLNIQPLAIRVPLHSSSSSKCAEGNVYNEMI